MGSAAEADEETDVGVTAFFHETPFALKVLCDVVIFGGKDLFDGDVYAEVVSWKRSEWEEKVGRKQGTFVDVAKGARAEFLPIAADVLWKGLDRTTPSMKHALRRG